MAKKRMRRTKRRARRVSNKKENLKVQRIVFTTKRKINLALRNLLLFIILALVSYVLYKVIKPDSLFHTLFSLLTIVFASVALAFLIVLLVFLVLKVTKKPEEMPKPRKRRRRR